MRPEPLPDSGFDALVRLGALAGADVRRELLLARRLPRGYALWFWRRLSLRGMDDFPELPERERCWIALVDALASRGRLVELDWKVGTDAVSEVRGLTRLPASAWRWADREGLQTIIDSFYAPLDLRRIGDSAAAGLFTCHFLELLGARTSAHGIALGYLDIGADCYPTVALCRDDLEAARACAAAASPPGCGLRTFDEHASD